MIQFYCIKCLQMTDGVACFDDTLLGKFGVASLRLANSSTDHSTCVHVEADGCPLFIVDTEHAVSPWQEDMEPV